MNAYTVNNPNIKYITIPMTKLSTLKDNLRNGKMPYIACIIGADASDNNTVIIKILTNNNKTIYRTISNPSNASITDIVLSLSRIIAARNAINDNAESKTKSKQIVSNNNNDTHGNYDIYAEYAMKYRKLNKRLNMGILLNIIFIIIVLIVVSTL